MRIYNSKTHAKEEFVPVQPGEVRIYACGPTVYNYFHIGNARPLIVFDTLRRYFEHTGLRVEYVVNLTDVDDKMIRRANEEGVTVKEIGDKYIQAFFEDTAALNIRRATHHPRATEYIPEIIELVQKLVDKGYAYESQGDVYFDTQAYPKYGTLSGRDLEELQAGARVEVGERKRNPMDFALWKAKKPGEPAWESPWGLGRPGWHIECSAMSMSLLGETIDIHCGGEDLLFPHHENEMAQSEAATGKPFARYWMHNAFINMNNQKMSKSTGNFSTAHDVLQNADGEAVRLFMLSAHYRSPVNFSASELEQAQAALSRLYAARDSWQFLLERAPKREMNDGEHALVASMQRHLNRFDEAMSDDLNTATALGALFELVREGNMKLTAESCEEVVSRALIMLTEYAGLFGLLEKRRDEGDEQVKQLVEQRQAARAAKDWKKSDELRDAIQALGYVVEDTQQGAKVRRV